MIDLGQLRHWQLWQDHDGRSGEDWYQDIRILKQKYGMHASMSMRALQQYEVAYYANLFSGRVG